MSRTTLKKLLGRRGRLAAALQPLLEELEPGIGIQDVDGTWLAGAELDPAAANTRLPVLLAGEPVGWVGGAGRGERLAAVRGLLTYAAGQEAEKRSLATEVLERYRELNLLYTLSEKLAANPQPASMAATALDEARRLISAQAGLVLMRCGEAPCPELMASAGAAERLRAAQVAASLVERVLRSGQPELENQVPGTGGPGHGGGSLSLLCAPLRTEGGVLGALLLVREPPQVFSAGELKLLNSVALQVARVLELARLHQMAVENARLERELQMARQVQASLIPGHMPELPGWEFAAEWQPALEVSGDYYDLIPAADGEWSLVIADVAGKGMPASLFMVFTHSVLRATVDQAPSPGEGLARVNDLLARESHDGLFVTLFFARLDPRTGDLTYVNAGHNPPLLYHAASSQVTALAGSGIALGLLPGATYEQATLHLEPGDLVLLYTDGLTEAFDGGRQQFGPGGLGRVLREHRGGRLADLLGALEAAVEAFTGGAPPSDDRTLLALKRL